MTFYDWVFKILNKFQKYIYVMAALKYELNSINVIKRKYDKDTRDCYSKNTDFIGN